MKKYLQQDEHLYMTELTASWLLGYDSHYLRASEFSSF